MAWPESQVGRASQLRMLVNAWRAAHTALFFADPEQTIT
jgi:hypothetical protein